MVNTAELRKKLIRGVQWNYVINFVAGVFQFIFTAILARLLLPSDWGIYNMAFVFISLIVVFQDTGLGYALIQRRNEIEKTTNIVFFSNIILGIFWYLLFYNIAPYVAIYFNKSIVVLILRIMAFAFLINAVSLTHKSLLIKELRFKELFYLQLIFLCSSGVVSIFLALLKVGVWSLVIGYLVAQLMMGIAIWCFVRWRPRLTFDFRIAKEVLPFGGLAALEIIFSWALSRMDSIFIGRFLGAAKLGFYYLGSTLGRLPFDYIASPLHTVLYPTFCKLQDDKESLKMYYLKYIFYVSIFVFPLSIAIFHTSDYFVLIFFGYKWNVIIAVIKFMVIIGAFASLVTINQEIYRAIGRPDIMVKFFFVRSIISIPLYYFASKISIVSVCIVHILLTIIFVPINIFICAKVVKWNITQFWKSINLPIFISVLLLSIGYVCKYALFTLTYFESHSIVQLLLLLFILIFTYFLLVSYLCRKEINEIKGLIRQTLGA